VLTFIVTRRNREIGIRMALGARRGSVMRLVLGEMAVVIPTGIAAGVIAAYLCGRFVETQLFGVRSFDTMVFAASAGLLGAFAFAAAVLSAWRAARLEPTAALRQLG
jgi:ABC-type antimicrobial peptide transport system permease subunit